MGAAAFLSAVWGGAKSVGRSLTALGWACIVAVVLLFLLLGTCNHYSHKEAKRITREAEARAKALEAKGKADTMAADERLWDFKINHNREKERTDAVTTSPDGPTSPVQRRLACVWLRDQASRPADVPAECRSDGGG